MMVTQVCKPFRGYNDMEEDMFPKAMPILEDNLVKDFLEKEGM